MVVEKAVSRANHGLAIAPGVPGDSDAGSDVIGVCGNAFHDAESFFSDSVQSRRGFKNRQPFDVVAHAVVQSELVIDFPTVLGEDAERLVVEGTIRLTNPLD